MIFDIPLLLDSIIGEQAERVTEASKRFVLLIEKIRKEVREKREEKKKSMSRRKWGLERCRQVGDVSSHRVSLVTAENIREQHYLQHWLYSLPAVWGNSRRERGDTNRLGF